MIICDRCGKDCGPKLTRIESIKINYENGTCWCLFDPDAVAIVDICNECLYKLKDIVQVFIYTREDKAK